MSIIEDPTGALWNAIMQGADVPELVLEQPEWMRFGACRGQDPALWFPVVGGDGAEGKRICAGCPVREECAAYAIADPTLFGIWGGTSFEQRKRARNQPAA